jgi:PhoH-like ATPase
MQIQSEFLAKTVDETTDKRGGAERLQVDMAGTRTKNYVLDTNVLLHDPQSLFHFADNDLWIPVEVLAELDKFKQEQSERGANARAVHRHLTQIFGHNSELVTSGAPISGGTIRIALNDFLGRKKSHAEMDRFLKIFPDMEKIDHRILACCLYVHHKSPRPTILVTKDLNMQLKAMVLGIPAEDYLTDKVEARDVESYDLPRIEVTANELQRFASTRQLDAGETRTGFLALNDYVLLSVNENKTMPARYYGDGTFQRLNVPERIHIPKGIDIRPMNLGQQCLVDALLDPDISLVTCYGQAGTGKTLMAVAAGLSQVAEAKFDGLTISRPVVPMGDSVGFLPGSLDEKMRPWLQCIYDALEVLLPTHAPKAAAFENKKQAQKPAKKTRDEAPSPKPQQNGGHSGPMKPWERLVEQGLLEVEALCYIRGRSIPRRFFVLDEAQQLTPLEAKTIVTRMSKGSKLVMVGDPAQIDNPYVDSRSNGLVYTRTRLKGQAITAHVALNKGERSPLAEIGAQRM